MSIQTIEIFESETEVAPSFRFGPLPPVCLWQFTGSVISETLAPRKDNTSLSINRAVQVAATKLSKKVSNRRVRIEVIIEPLMPPIEIDASQLIPIISVIGENASASVEPGPGFVIFKTWWRGRHVGVDAIGKNGMLPDVVRKEIFTPGFTTRVADWDTGFGLHDARLDSNKLGFEVELFDDPDGIGFRVIIPLKRGRPVSPPELFAGFSDQKKVENSINFNGEIPFKNPYSFWKRSTDNVRRDADIAEA